MIKPLRKVVGANDELVFDRFEIFESDGGWLKLNSEHRRSRIQGLSPLSLLGLESGETNAVDVVDVVKRSGAS